MPVNRILLKWVCSWTFLFIILEVEHVTVENRRMMPCRHELLDVLVNHDLPLSQFADNPHSGKSAASGESHIQHSRLEYRGYVDVDLIIRLPLALVYADGPCEPHGELSDRGLDC